MSFLRSKGGTAKDCFTTDERPSTPPEIRKFRRSTNLEPGRRFVHHGLADDFQEMALDKNVYGVMSDRGKNTAADLLSHNQPNELQRINMVKAEQVYKTATREQLGKTVDRKVILPSKFTQDNVPFGASGKSTAEPAKDIIFPSMSEDSIKGEEIYIRSHGSYGPGQQKDRHYQWPVDPSETRFGRKGDTIAFNGVSKNIAEVLSTAEECNNIVNPKKVEDFKSMSDILGTTRNLGQGSSNRPEDTVYGRPSAQPNKKNHTALEIIRGRYKPEHQLPDEDLGKSITPGFRNISIEDRAYGCPSIRSDLPAGARSRRSLADSQNYGDDVPARDLVNPPAFSDMAIAPTAMSEPRSKDKLVQLFAKIGHPLDREISDALFAEASGGSSVASINNFRAALNEYLDAIETDRIRQWRRERGL